LLLSWRIGATTIVGNAVKYQLLGDTDDSSVDSAE
jgi:hypothetical protein